MAEATTQRKYRWRDDRFYARVSNDIVNKVNAYRDNYNALASDYQKRNSARKYTYEDAYVSDSADWADAVAKRKESLDAEADSVTAYIDRFADGLNADWVKQIKDSLTVTKKNQGIMAEAAAKDNEWWSNFNSEELVGKYGSAENAYKYYQRSDGYYKKYGGLSSKELQDYIDQWDNDPIYQEYSELKNRAHYVTTGERGATSIAALYRTEQNARLEELEQKKAQLDEEKEWLTAYHASVDYDEKSKLDIATAEKELDYLERLQAFAENELQDLANDPNISTEELIQIVGQQYPELVTGINPEKAISEKKRYINEAKRIQNSIRLAGVGNPEAENYDPEFQKYSEYVEDEEYSILEDPSSAIYHYINNRQDTGISLAKNNLNAYNKMTDEEIGIYNYYFNKHGYEAAHEYVNDLEAALNARVGQDIYSRLEDKPLLELIFGLAAGLDQFGSGIKSLFSGDEYKAPSAVQYASAMVREDLGDGSFGQVLYDLSTTTANMLPSMMLSMINPALGASAGSVLLGASAAGNAYQEMVNLGYDSGQARAYSTLVGASEAGLQYLMGGLGKLGGKLTGKTAASLASKFDSAFARLAVTYGTSMISEGAEEYLQEILTPVFKNLTLKTDEEVKLISEDAIYSFLLGALTSGVMEGPGTFATALDMRSGKAANILAQKQYGDSIQELIDEGLASDPNSESYKLAALAKEKTDAQKTLSGYEIRQLVKANQAQFTAEDYEAARSKAESRLTELGENKNVRKLARLAAKRATGQTLTRDEISTLARSQYGAQVAKELSTPTEQVTNGVKPFNVAYKADPVYKSLGERVGTETPARISDTGKAVNRTTGDEIDLTNPTFKEFTENGAVLEVDGKAVNSNQIDYATEEQGTAINAIGKIEHMTPVAASALYAKLDMTKPVMEQLNGMDEAFTYGYYNYSEADLDAGLFSGNLTQEQKNDAYKLGQYVAKENDADKTKAYKQMRTAAQAKAEKTAEKGKAEPKSKKTTITYNEGNGKIVDFNKTGMKLSAKQKAAAAVAKILHKLGLGTNFEFFSSEVNAEGKRVFINDEGVEEAAYSGVYRKSDGTIRIDLNAYNGKGLTLNALAHELTHFIQQWSDTKYKVLADFLIKTYETSDMTMHQRVLREQTRLEGIRKKKVSYAEAYDEVVANAMSKMLDDGKLIERLTELKATDKKLAQKLWEGFKKILAKFIGIYEKESALFYDADDLMQMKETFEQLQNMFAEALVEASENFQASLAAKGAGKQINLSVEGQRSDKTVTKVRKKEAASEHYSSQETDFDKEFDYSELNWVRDLGIITEKDAAIFERTIKNEILRGAKPQSANGEFIIDTGKCLMFTDGDFHNPTLSRVIVFATEYESLLDEAKRRILYEARSTGEVQESKQVIEDLYGHGFAVEYTQTVYGTDAWQNRGRERANSKGSNRRYHAKSLKERLTEEGVEYLLEDDGEAYSSHATDVDARTLVQKNSYEGLPSDAFYNEEYSYIYSYDFLTAQKDMTVVDSLPTLQELQTGGRIDSAKVLAAGYKNILEMGGTKVNDTYSIINTYTNRPLQIGKNSITHGLGAENINARRTNARLAAVIGELCKNAIPICALPNTHNVRGTYGMAVLVNSRVNGKDMNMIALITVEQQNGNVQSVDFVDVAHAVSGRLVRDIEKENRSAQGTPPGTKSEWATRFSSTLKITQFLDIVNRTHQGYLSDDVISKLGEERRGPKKGLFSGHETDDGVGLNEIKDTIQKGIGVKWNNGNVIKLEKAEYAAVISRISTEYKRRTIHGGVQYIDRSTDGKDAKFFLYLFVDHGFDNYEIIARLDYAKQDELVHRLRRIIQNGRNAGEAVDSIEQLRDIDGSLDSGRVGNQNRSISETDDKKTAGRSGQQWQRDNGRAGSADSSKFDERSNRPEPRERSTERIEEQHSEHEIDNISNRALLANAFEGIAKDSEEYRLIQAYQRRVKLLDEQEGKLAKLNAEIRKITFGTTGKRDMQKLRQLQAEAKITAETINRHDKKLLELEASKPLRKVIAHERAQASRKTKAHMQQVLQNKQERAEKTALRRKIRKSVHSLRKLLKLTGKKQVIKEDVQEVVAKALQAADILFADNYSAYDMLRNGIITDMSEHEEALAVTCAEMLEQLDSMQTEGYEGWQVRQEAEARLKAKMSGLKETFARERRKRNNTKVTEVLKQLADAYAALAKSKQRYIRGAYSEAVHNFLTELQNSTGGTIVKDMTKEQLEAVYTAYETVLNTVRKANKLFVKGKSASVEQTAEKIVNDFKSKKIPKGKAATVARNLANKIGWSYEKLYYALERIGSEAFTELVMNIANSENTVMQDIIEATTFRDQIVEEYGFNNWPVNKIMDKEFLDNTGKSFKLTLGQLMSLYAYSRRESAWDHIEYGGFVFGKKELTETGHADSYKLTKAQVEAMTDLLTEEQKAYVRQMQKFLSETMGEKGNEVTMLLYGIKLFKEKNYFPIRIAGQFKENVKEAEAKETAGFTSMVNARFTHAQNSKAKEPFVLEGFMEAWSDHVNEMSRYHGTVPALEDFRKVMNHSFYFDTKSESTSVRSIMENTFGKQAVQYFDNLYNEANSGAIWDRLEKPSKTMLRLFRKNSVAYKLSVAIQQPSAMARAYAVIDRKFFIKKGFGRLTAGVAKAVSDRWTKMHTNAYNEMLKYAPGVTMAKEIGGFDTATGGTLRSYLLDTGKSLKQSMKTENIRGKGKAVLDKVDDNAIANLPNLADKIAWIEIWEACKREVMTKRGNEFFADGGVRYAKEKKGIEKEEATQYSERDHLDAIPYKSVKAKYGLTDGELYSLTSYKSSKSYKINAMLRDGTRMEDLSEADREFIKNLDSALAKLPKHQGPVYRNLSFDDFGGKEAFDGFIAVHSQNNIITYDAYTSASAKVDGYSVEGEYVAHLIIPESAHAHDMSGIGNNFESEVLYSRGAEFVVDKVTFDNNGIPTVYLKEDIYNAEGEHGQLYSEERSETVQQVQTGKQGRVYLPSVSRVDSGRDAHGGLSEFQTGGEHGQLHSQERSKTMQSVRSEKQGDSNLQSVSEADTPRGAGRRLSKIQTGGEVSDTYTEIPGEEAFLVAVGERFTEVIRATQVYDSIFSKSPMLKSKSVAVQYLVSFMNEANTVANMAEKAVRDITSGNAKQGFRVLAAVAHSIVLNNVLKSIIHAMHDDDEEETYIEKYVEALTENLINDLIPFNYMPIARDAWSIIRGYNVERPDMAIVANAINALNGVIQQSNANTEDMTEEQLVEWSKKIDAACWDLAGSVLAFFGIPLTNVRKDINAVLRTANSSNTFGSFSWNGVEDAISDALSADNSKHDRIYRAMVEGDMEYLGRLRSTYKTDASYNSAVRKGLRENDPRIHAAAQARYEGNTEEYKRICREIHAEGTFSLDEIIDAINSEENAIKRKLEPEKVTSDYTATGYVEAIIAGDTAAADTMREDILAVKVANGQTEEAAQKAFASNVAGGIRDNYSAGLLDEAAAENMLVEYTGMKKEDAAGKVRYWAFCNENPEYSLSEANVDDYYEFAEPEQIPLDVFWQYVSGTKGITEIYDEWGDVTVSKREQILDVIHSLPLTWEQKDALYLAAGYSQNKIWDVPW